MRTSFRAVALAAAVIVGLTGCEKPKPEVTVFSGANSVHSEAACWAADANATCDLTAIGGLVTPFTVRQGSTLGISVDSDVAEQGWIPMLVVNGQSQPLINGVLHRRYWKMVYPETAGTSLMGQSLALQVVSTTSDGKGVRGAWLFNLSSSESLDNA